MVRGTELTLTEQAVILELSKTGMSIRAISKQINRSIGSVHKVIKNGEAREALERSGRPSKMDERGMRRVVRLASSEPISARMATEVLQMSMSVRSMQLHMEKNLQLNWTRFRRTTALQKHHIKARLEWANEKIEWGDRKWIESSLVMRNDGHWMVLMA